MHTKSQFNLKLGNYEFKLKLSSLIFLNQLETHAHTKSQLDLNLAFELEVETSPILIQLKTTYIGTHKISTRYEVRLWTWIETLNFLTKIETHTLIHTYKISTW